MAGFWLGAFAWFGGFVWVQQIFNLFSLIMALFVVALRWRAMPHRWVRHAVFFFGSQFLFIAAISAGQVFYFRPSSVAETIYLFSAAMQGEL